MKRPVQGQTPVSTASGAPLQGREGSVTVVAFAIDPAAFRSCVVVLGLDVSYVGVATPVIVPTHVNAANVSRMGTPLLPRLTPSPRRLGISTT